MTPLDENEAQRIAHPRPQRDAEFHAEPDAVAVRVSDAQRLTHARGVRHPGRAAGPADHPGPAGWRDAG